MAPGVSSNINIGVPTKIQSPNSTLLTIVLLAVVCALFGFFMVLPKKSEVAVKYSQLQKLTTQNAGITSQLNKLNELVGILQSHPQDVKELDEALPLNGKTFDLQLLLESFANQSGLAIGSINLSGNLGAIVAGNTALLADPYSATRSLQTISGEAYVIGTFPQLMDFLKKVENSDRIMQVSSLEVSGDKNNGLALKINFEAYYFSTK